MNPMLLCSLLLCPVLSLAQEVWRCGPDGRSYADAPCAGGRIVQVADARSADRVAEARADVQRLKGLARDLAAERRLRDAEGRRQGAAALTVPVAVNLQQPVSQPQAKPNPRSRRHAAATGTSRTVVRATRHVAD